MTFETFIPPRSKSVLEVTDKLAEDFQSTEENFLMIQPDCKYTVAEDLSEIGGEFDFNSKSEVSNKFDTIILQSSLIGNLDGEKLSELIKNSIKFLSERGTLIFTLDNIGYAENILAILQGQPPKFKITLSRAELEGAIKSSELNQFRSLNVGRKMSLPKSLIDLAKIDTATFLYIIVATPEKLPPKTMIQTLVGEKLVCAPIRIQLPNSFLLTEPSISISYAYAGKPYKLFSAEKFERRIFINQRLSFPTFRKGADFFQQIKNSGYLYLSEMDDHPVLWENDYSSTGNINFIGVHAIQTSTKYLADFLSQYNPLVKVFPNQLKKLQPPRNFDEEFKQSRPVTIFFGALNRDKEFEELLPSLNRLAKVYGKKILFKILARQKHFHALETENKILVGDPNFYDGQFVAYDKYEETLRSSDISLLPLQDNKFNRAKSDLKFIECANCGSAVLASSVVYSDVIRDGENGFIFHDMAEFEKKLKLLIDSQETRRKFAESAYDYVKHNRLMSQHYEERLDWYNELFARLPELNEKTQARIDKIAPNFKDEPPELPQNDSPPSEGISPPNAEIIIPV